MDKLNDFLKNLMDRFSNPLIFSFICSWLVINWRITVALLWYDSELIEKTGSDSLFSFINGSSNWCDSFWEPFGVAIVYTFLMPPIKMVIQAFNTKISQKGEEWNLKILKGGKIGIDKFLQLREDHKKRTFILEKVIGEESDYIHKYNEVNTHLLEVQSELNEEKKKMMDAKNVLDSYTNVAVLAGTWVNNYESSTGVTGEETVYINRNEYYVVSKFAERKQVFEIRDFYYDKSANNVFFVKELVPAEKEKRPLSEHFSINRLRFEGKDILTGRENGTTKIQYTRK